MMKTSGLRVRKFPYGRLSELMPTLPMSDLNTCSAEGKWSWAWHPQLSVGQIHAGYHTHGQIRAANPELYDGGLTPIPCGWARVHGNTLEIGCYPGPLEPDWGAIAELIAARNGLQNYTVVRLPILRSIR